MKTGNKCNYLRFVILGLIALSLVFGTRAETIIVSGDSKLEDIAPISNAEDLLNESIENEDFDGLVSLASALIESNSKVQQRIDFLIASQNSSEKRDENYRDTIKDLTNSNQQQSKMINSFEEKVNKVSNQLMIMQASLTKYKATYWVSVLAVFFLGLGIAKVHYVFKMRGKKYWLLQWIKKSFPFKVNPPDIENVSYRMKDIKM